MGSPSNSEFVRCMIIVSLYYSTWQSASEPFTDPWQILLLGPFNPVVSGRTSARTHLRSGRSTIVTHIDTFTRARIQMANKTEWTVLKFILARSTWPWFGFLKILKQNGIGNFCNGPTFRLRRWPFQGRFAIDCKGTFHHYFARQKGWGLAIPCMHTNVTLWRLDPVQNFLRIVRG